MTEKAGRNKILQLLASIGTKMPDESLNIDAPLYDWHLPRFFTAQQMKKVNNFAKKVADLISVKFGTLCQGVFEATITSAGEHYASQFLSQQPAAAKSSGDRPPAQPATAEKAQTPSNYYLHFGVNNEEPCGFISIPPQTAVVWTTQLLGDTESKEDPNKVLSELETSLLFDMASLIINCVAAGVDKWTLKPAAAEMLDHLPIQPRPADELCKITFQVKKAGSQVASEAHIIILCDKLAQALGESSQSAAKFTPKDVARAIQNHIETIPVPVTAQFACVPFTVEEILNLAPGDIMLLDKKIEDPCVLIAAGKTVCKGQCAKSANKYSIVITETLF